jgi:hypothetical protein
VGIAPQRPQLGDRQRAGMKLEPWHHQPSTLVDCNN